MPVTHGLIKRDAVKKHTSHVCNRRDVPHVQWLIKGSASVKHISHVCDKGGVPAV